MARHTNPSVIRSSVVALLVAISASTVLISARRSDGAPRPTTAPEPVAVASRRQDIVLILTDINAGTPSGPCRRCDPNSWRTGSSSRTDTFPIQCAVRAARASSPVSTRTRPASTQTTRNSRTGVPGVPRLVDRGDLASRRRVPDRVDRQVPERIRRFLRPARLGPLVRDVGRRAYSDYTANDDGVLGP